MIVKDWVPAWIVDSEPANINKYSLQPMAMFDADEFPFVIVSGMETINLVNVIK